jgi:hypothetical protein
MKRKQAYRQLSNRNGTGLIDICQTCPHRQACTELSALSNLPDPPGYIPLGEVLPCPDGFRELLLNTEMPGETWKTKELAIHEYAAAEDIAA